MADLYTPTGNPQSFTRGYASLIRQEFQLIADALLKLRLVQTLHFQDINSAGFRSVVVPRAAKLEKAHLVLEAGNSLATTTISTTIEGAAVGASSIVVASTASEGDVVTVTPTSDNVAAEGDVLKMTSDGGGTGVLPATVTLVWSYE